MMRKGRYQLSRRERSGKRLRSQGRRVERKLVIGSICDRAVEGRLATRGTCNSEVREVAMLMDGV